MKQRWDDVLFLHWPVQPELLRPLLPKGVELDLFEGNAWIGFVFFEVNGLRPRLIPPIPFVNTFPELNVRTYIRRNGKPGVYFLSMDATNKIAIKMARATYSLPYLYADISLKRSATSVSLSSIRKERDFPRESLQVKYKPTGENIPNEEGSLTHWLVERYCLWSVIGDELCRTDIHHPKWVVEAVEVELATNTMAQFLPREIFSIPPIAHYSLSKTALFWPPVKEK